MAEHHKLTHDEQWLRRVALQLVKGCDWIIRERAHLLDTTIAGSRQARVRGTRRHEIRRIPVTLATLPLSIPYSRALRDATPLAGWTAPVLGPGTGR